MPSCNKQDALCEGSLGGQILYVADHHQTASSDLAKSARCGGVELRVEAVGNKNTCYYDSVKKIEGADDTFKDAGKMGLWTKADSVRYFDDLRITAK